MAAHPGSPYHSFRTSEHHQAGGYLAVVGEDDNIYSQLMYAYVYACNI